MKGGDEKQHWAVQANAMAIGWQLTAHRRGPDEFGVARTRNRLDLQLKLLLQTTCSAQFASIHRSSVNIL